MATSLYYVDYGSGNDTTGNGAIGTPWKTIAKALSGAGGGGITQNTTDGDQINLKAGTAHVNAAALDLASYGTPAAAYPLIIRGYTTAANDGGVGEIDCNGATMWAATTYDYIMLVDLKIYASINVNLIVLDSNCTLFRCEVYITGGAVDYVITLGIEGVVSGCYIHGTNAGGIGINANTNATITGNYIDMGLNGLSYGIRVAAQAVVTGNVIRANAAGAYGIYQNNTSYRANITGNILYNLAAGTGPAIFLGDAAAEYGHVIMNNIICGWSGAGGTTVTGTCNITMLGYNAFWNNANSYAISDQKFIDLTAFDVALAADPFVDAANGDFSLTTAAKTALRGLGWPAAYLGAHANTDGHVTIGPIQYGEAEVCDYPSEDDVRDGTTFSTYTGNMTLPAVAKVTSDTSYGTDGTELTGTYHVTEVAEVLDSVSFGALSAETGTYHAPDAGEVTDNAVFGPASGTSGTYHRPETSEVVSTAVFGIASGEAGTQVIPAVGDVEAGVNVGVGVGTFTVPAEADVKTGTGYGEDGTEFTGSLAAGGGLLKGEKRGGKQ